eukprot:4812531-Amphidinium_carterae.2
MRGDLLGCGFEASAGHARRGRFIAGREPLEPCTDSAGHGRRSGGLATCPTWGGARPAEVQPH